MLYLVALATDGRDGPASRRHRREFQDGRDREGDDARRGQAHDDRRRGGQGRRRIAHDPARRRRPTARLARGDRRRGRRATSIEVSRPANGGRNWSKAEATTLYGWYTGLAYLLPILGGLIADKLIGTHRSMLVGGITIALGHIRARRIRWSTSGGMSIFMKASSLIAGSAPATSADAVSMVKAATTGRIRARWRPSRSSTWASTSAFAICAFVCGTLGEKVGWHWGFGAAAVGMILGLAMYIWGRRRFLEGVGLPPEGKPNYAPFFVVLALVLSAGVAWFFHAGGFGAISRGFEAIATNLGHGATVAAILLLMTALIGWLLAIQAREDVPKVAAILVFILFNTFFWMAFEQAGSTLNLFAEEKTNLSLGGWSMPASWFQSVNPALIILLAPLFAFIWPALAKRKLEPKHPGKIGWGLLLLGIGYIVMVFGGQAAATGVKVSMFYLFLTYFFHTLGELCLSPTGLSFVTKAAPMKFVSLLMGIWFLSSFAAGVLGGAIGSYVEEIEKGTVRLPWSGTFGGQGDFFALFVVSSIGAAIVIFALSPVLNRMSREV
ncbi:MAG: peptide MFS transporter [Phycisphaerales bacterium]